MERGGGGLKNEIENFGPEFQVRNIQDTLYNTLDSRLLIPYIES